MDYDSETKNRKKKLFYDRTLSVHRPKWMVMGSFPLLCEAARRNIASVRFSALLWAIILLMVLQNHCGESAGGCNVDECSSHYQRAIRRLEGAQEKDPSADLSMKRCRVSKKLHRCLHRIRRVCRGNLLYHSIKHIYDRDQRDFDCSKKPTIAPPSNFPSFGLVTVKTNISTATMTTTTSASPRDGDICRYTGTSPHKHCGMFGDPHLRTFSDVFNTCKVEGTWPLIDNDYMVVMVTNVPVKDGSSATVTTKITVLIKAAGQCAGQRHYVATSEQLPGAFTDGSSEVGSVEVVETDPGKRVEIRAGFIGTTVIIRQVARYLTFAIRIPEEHITGLASRTQLCVQGCPADHQLPPIQTYDLPEANEVQIPSDNHPTTPSNPGDVEVHLSIQEVALQGTELPIQYFNEKEARDKCKQILLDLQDEEDSAKDPEEEEQSIDSSKSAKASFKSLSSLSSAAFSSLASSSENRPPPHGKKHHRMAAARQLPGEVLHSSSKRPRGSKAKRSRDKNRSKRSSRTGTSKDRPCLADKDEKYSNFYFKSCVFDLMMTGDINFALAAKAALDDVKRTHLMGDDAPGTSLEVVRLLEPVTGKDADCVDFDSKDTEGMDDPGGSASSILISNLTLLICVIFSCAYVNNFFLLSNFVSTVKSKRKETKSFKSNQNFFQTGTTSCDLIWSEAS